MARASSRLGEAVIEIRADLKKLRKDFDQAERITKKSTREMEQGFTGVTGSVQTLTHALGALGLTMSALELTRMVRDTFRWAEALEESARKLGITVEQLQQLQIFAERSNVPIRQLEQGLQRFTRRLGEARAGGGEAKIAFDQLGISAAIAAGDITTTNQALVKALKGIQALPDEQQRLKALFKLFDQEGAEAFSRMGIKIADANGELVDMDQILTAMEVRTLADVDRKFGIIAQTVGQNFRLAVVAVATEIQRMNRIIDKMVGPGSSLRSLLFLVNPALGAAANLLGTGSEAPDERSAGGLPDPIQDPSAAARLKSEQERLQREKDRLVKKRRDAEREITLATLRESDDRLGILAFEYAERRRLAEEALGEGGMDPKEIERRLAQFDQAFLGEVDKLKSDLELSFEGIGESFASMLGSMVLDSEVSFDKIGKAFAAMIIQMGIQEVAGAAFGQAFGGVGAALSGLGSAFTGGSASSLSSPGITINNNTGQPSGVESNFDGTTVIIGAVQNDILQGGKLSQTLKSTYGLRNTGRVG